MLRKIVLPLLLLLSLPIAADAAERAFVVIVAADSAWTMPSRDALALIYKRKQLFWGGGVKTQAVNLPPAHPLRRAFSQTLLGRLPEEMDAYWQDMYFHGVLPPYVLASEEAVVRFVATTPGAIGYVSPCAVDSRVMVVMSFGDPHSCQR